MSSLNIDRKVISVSALNNYLKNLLEENEYLQDIFIKGEISNFKEHNSGHFYFSLKDESSKINCVMFKSYAQNVNFKLEDGLKVIIKGSIGVYTQAGTYQIYVRSIEKEGLGNLYLELEKLKEKLEKEGLFDPLRKKKLPKYPFKIAVVSAKEGAAIQDVVTTINRRWPLASITLYPCLVQGKEAAPSIIKALKKANESDDEVIILTRGGGSIEDLWAFNDETLARVIYNLKKPIISAIGHEVDFTIAEFVSDLRAPTPTAAAEMVTPKIEEVLENVSNTKEILKKSMQRMMQKYSLELMLKQSELDINKYKIYLDNKRLKAKKLQDEFINSIKMLILDNKATIEINKKSLINLVNNKLEKKKSDFISLVGKLDSLSPLKVFKRGYAYVKKDDKIIKSIKDVKIDEIIDVNVYKGSFKAKVIEKREEK